MESSCSDRWTRNTFLKPFRADSQRCSFAMTVEAHCEFPQTRSWLTGSNVRRGREWPPKLFKSALARSVSVGIHGLTHGTRRVSMSIQQTQDGVSVPTSYFRKLNVFTMLCCSTLLAFPFSMNAAAEKVARPAISFTVNPTIIAAGGTVHLAYRLRRATSATLSNGAQTSPYPATSDSGPTTVSRTTIFTLTAVGPGGRASKSIRVTVKPAKKSPSVTAPVISSFTASAPSVAAGGSSVLRWTVKGTSPKVTLNGVAAVIPTTVKPSATTSYYYCVISLIPRVRFYWRSKMLGSTLLE